MITFQAQAQLRLALIRARMQAGEGREAANRALLTRLQTDRQLAEAVLHLALLAADAAMSERP
jgi:hypothetical protein